MQSLIFNNIPNYKNLNESYLKPSYDPTGEYSVPYFFTVWWEFCITKKQS
ncbi:MAG: hypothetical protein L6V93_07625 [Clostridiales bacterium]|nr:MAG: hypothetical protein L6V93_07625 [Clostridiales bacterium]